MGAEPRAPAAVVGPGNRGAEAQAMPVLWPHRCSPASTFAAGPATISPRPWRAPNRGATGRSTPSGRSSPTSASGATMPCATSPPASTASSWKTFAVPGIALCVPPGPDGAVPQATLAAAALLALDEVYRVGGAQAIAAMAYGTETIRPVDVIVGPGNVYVTLAKREVAGVVGIEATAGPSELVVVADESAPPDYAAIDLMAQAEHGPNGAALLVTWSEALAADVAASIDRLLAESSRRADTEATLRSGG